MLPRFTLLALLFALAFLVIGCGGESPEDIALDAAERWTTDSVASIAGDIGGAVTSDIPLLAQLASSAIEEQIREKVRWSFEPPSETGTDRYSVVARAIVGVTVPVPLVADKEYDVSVAFNLVADTGKREIVSSRIDPLSLDVQEK